MLENSFGLLFFLKQPKNHKNKLWYVFMRITVNGKRKELSIKMHVDPRLWNPDNGCAEGSDKKAKNLNVYLDAYREKVYQAKRLLMDMGKDLSAEGIKDILMGKGEERKMILVVFQLHNDQMRQLVGKEFAKGTLERYETSKEHTRSFIQWKYNVDDLDIKRLDHEFISQYAFWLKEFRNCGYNSAMKYLSNFKKVVLACVKNKWLKEDPFIYFKMSPKEVYKEPLSADELKTITAKEFSINRVGQVRDIFLFSCYTGLAYIDIKNLKLSEIVTGIDGGLWVCINREKTGVPSRIPLLSEALRIMDKYKSFSPCEKTGNVLPVLSNQKMNAYLKEIADLCGITKPITFHTARHTFATTVTLTNGVPIETVSQMMGHKSLSQTQHYAKVLDVKVSEDMNTLRNRLSQIE